MSAGKNSAKTNRSYGQRRKTLIEKYLNTPFPIEREGMDPFMPQEGERFVPVFHYKEVDVRNAGHNERKGNISKRYIVSDQGNIISFENPNKPRLMKQTPKNAKEEDSYIQAGYWDLHRAVWFSFAADAIVNQTERPKYYRIHESFWTLEGLVELADLGSEEFGKVVMVHHEDLNPRNNSLSNLELLPNNGDDDISEEWHTWLHNLKSLTDDERFMAILKNRKITESTIIELDNKVSISEIDQEAFEKEYGAVLIKYRYHVLIKHIIGTIGRSFPTFFSKERNGAIVIDGRTICISVLKPDNSSDNHIIKKITGAGVKIDFMWDEGHLTAIQTE